VKRLISVSLSRHREFLGHVATLMSGKAIAGVVALATMPIVARLFDPQEFGIAAVYMAIVSIVGQVGSLRYEEAIILQTKMAEIQRLTRLCWLVLSIMCTGLLITVASHMFGWVSWATLDLLNGWAWLLPIGVALTGLLQIQESELNRQRKYRLLSGSLVAGNATTSGSRIISGFLTGSTSFGLISGLLLGQTARLCVQRTGIRWKGTGRMGVGTLRELTSVAKRHADFPLYSAPTGVIFAMGQNLPAVFLGLMFSPAVAGLYAMVRQILHVSVTMVSKSVSRVFLQKVATIRREDRSIVRAYTLTTGTLAAAGIPALIVLVLFGSDLAVWFLGDKWIDAGRFVGIVAPWVYMIWVMAPCKSVYVVLRRQGVYLATQITLTIARLGAFGWAYLVGADAELTLQAFIFVTVIGNLATMAMAMFLIRHADADLRRVTS
jgi:O-antigen/teichoic acid export membrane protein